MKKLFTSLFFLLSVIALKGQTRGFGHIDTADLKLTTCDFEKDANAMVLFDRENAFFEMSGLVTMERHKRVKILNEKGKEEGSVRIEYNNVYGAERIYNIEAQTINLEKGQIVTSIIDHTHFYFEHTDKNKDALVLSFPDVKEGSVIEYRYSVTRGMASNFPSWYFQSNIPVRYCEFAASFDPQLKFDALKKGRMPLLKDSAVFHGHIWAMSNVSSSKVEAFMRAKEDALESVALQLKEVDVDGKTIHLFDSWSVAGKKLADNKGYYKELEQSLSDEDKLIKAASELRNNDDKIAFLYNSVRTTMSWNGFQNWGTKDGIKAAWKKKAGNSGELNAILYHLLKKCGIKAYPMLVSTRDNGLLNPTFVDIFQLNNLVVYLPLDNARYYVLDATNKYYSYNQVPFNLLNSYGLCLDKDNNKYDMVFIETKLPSKEVVAITGEIGADAKMKGTGDVVSYGYNRAAGLELYKTEGEKKFVEFLSEKDNNLKITGLKLEDAEIDTLPLRQNFNFDYELNNSDNYILFCPNIFTSLHYNPFINETRASDVDFGYADNHAIFGRFKIPAGYKIESLPKDANIVMADKSIRFKRSLGIEESYISIHYEIDVKRTQFLKTEYPDLREFYKKMYDMLNEQIILKKG